MIPGRIPVYLICIISSTQVKAAAQNCRKATTPAEHAICANPDMRAADAAMSSHYASVYGALWTRTLKTQLAVNQRKWLVSRDAGCPHAACLGPRIVERDMILAALAAQVSESNPTLFNLHAVWLEGEWMASNQEPKTMRKFSDLPEENQPITLKAGELCDRSGACDDFGLTAQKLSDERGQRPFPLAIKPDAPLYEVLLLGKAQYELVPMPDGTLTAVGMGCPEGQGACGDITQVWRPLSPASRVHEADLSNQ